MIKWWIPITTTWWWIEIKLSKWFPNWNRQGTVFEFVRVIRDRESDEDYLIRYYLLSTRWLKNIFPNLSYRLVLHNTLRSDIDGLHDHPWPWYRKIISGGYFEDTPEGRFWIGRSRGWEKKASTDFHRLVLNPTRKEPTWSLFLMGPREKDWGFLSDDGEWIQWEEYLANRDKYFDETKY